MEIEKCRAALKSYLRRLQMRVHVLQDAAKGQSALLGFFAIIRTSEDVRFSTLRALNDQYHRLADGDVVPKELSLLYRRSCASVSLPSDDISYRWSQASMNSPLERLARPPSVVLNVADGQTARVTSPRKSRFLSFPPARIADSTSRPSSALSGASDARSNRASSRRSSCFLNLPVPMETIMDNTVTPASANSRRSATLSDPPSPPLTPTWAEDLQPTRSIRSSVSARSIRTSISMGGLRPRPVSSVFSLFCPEAIRHQLDPTKAMSRGVCKCGHDVLVRRMELGGLEDGFQLTPRFLAKSHHVGTGFGCVLCISSGKVGSYDDVAALKEHIHVMHDKWQMLHDRDFMMGNE